MASLRNHIFPSDASSNSKASDGKHFDDDFSQEFDSHPSDYSNDDGKHYSDDFVSDQESYNLDFLDDLF